MRYRGLGEVGLLVVSGAGLVLAWTQTSSDLGLTLWWLAVVLVGVLLPGWVVVRAVRGGSVGATDLGWAGPTGLALALATWLVAHLVGQRLPSLVVGPVVAAALLLVPLTRRRVTGRAAAPDDGPSGSWPAPAWAALTALVLATVRWLWVGGLALVPSKPTPRFQIWYQDLLYQTALTGELRRNLVPGYPMVDGEPLGYHWFFHALAAQLSGTGIDDLDIVTRLLPSTLVVLLVLLAAAVGHQVVGHWAGGIGAAAAIAVLRPVSVDVWVQTPVDAVPNYWQLSPTAALGWVFGLAVVGTLVAVLRRAPADRLAPAMLLPAFSIAAAGAKSAQLPVILCGLGLAAVVVVPLEWRRRRAPGSELRPVAIRYAACLGALVVITLLAVLFIYPGSYGLRFNPSNWPDFQKSLILGRSTAETGAAVGAIVVAFLRRWGPVLLLALGLLVLIRRRPTDPSGWMGVGALVGGLLAVMLLRHPSGSEYYFAIAAQPLAMALSGAGVAGYVRDELAARRVERDVDGAVDGPAPGRWAHLRGPLVLLVTIALAGLLLVLAVRRLARSTGRHPAELAGPHTDAMAIWAWFEPTLAFLVGLVVVITVAWLVRRRSARPLLRGTWAALLVLAVFAGGARILAPDLSLSSNPGPARSQPRPTDRPPRPVVPPALFDAGQYLRQHADPTDIVATNRVYNGRFKSGVGDNRDFSVAAFSGLRNDVAGFGYAPRMLQDVKPGESYILAPFWDQPRLDAEQALIEKPTAENLAAAYRTRGVRWIVADERSGPVSPDLATLTDLVSRTDGVWLARLRTPGS
ncbi:hypothetical protein [Terrabacter terrigena]|uniref:Glycosyltransferase RgtA/B/C/D-like domain-containing protein n=1 Tax=Terrabacter terrigena TaxID=574718 RepID=A0ABW3MRW1_9MICO